MSTGHTIEGEAVEVKPKRKSPGKPRLAPPNPNLYLSSPSYKASQRAKEVQALAAVPPQSTPSGNAPTVSHQFGRLLTNQSVGLIEVSEGALDAARYLVAVATGRKKGEQWRMRAAESILDRTGVTGSTVERAQIAAQAASSAGADLGAMLTKLVEARALAARKQGATDAETGQTPGKPPVE